MTAVESDKLTIPLWRRLGRGDVLAVLLLWAVVLGAYGEVAFLGRTFSTAFVGTASSTGPGPPVAPPGDPVDAPRDTVRLDPGASAWQFEPWAEVVAREIRGGEWPLWNPYSATGKPLAANMQSAAFDPLLLPVHLHPTPLTWDVCFLAAFLLGAMMAYLFFRNLGLGLVASFAGAAFFVLSGSFFLYSNNHFFRAYLYLPAAFLGVDRATAHRRPGAVLLLAASFAGLFFVGMPESTLFVLLAVMPYALYRVATAERRLPSLAGLAAGGALGAAITLPLAVLLAEYLPLSFHAHDASSKIGLQYDPGSFLLNWLVPFGQYARAWRGTRDWVGAAVLVPVIAALASPRVLRRFGGAFFVAFTVLFAAKLYGAPFIRDLGSLPIVVIASFPAFSPPIVAWTFVVVAAIGVEALREATPLRRLALGASPVLLGVLVLLWVNRATLRQFGGATSARPFVLALGVFLLAAGAALVLRPQVRAIVVVVIVVAELFAHAPRGIYAERAEPYRPPPEVGLLLEGGLRNQDRTFGFDARLFPDIPGALGIADVRTIDGLYPDRFFQYLHTFVQPAAFTRYVGGQYGGGPNEEVSRSETSRNRMWDLLGVRFVLSGGTEPESGTLISRVFASVPSSPAVRPAVFDLGGDVRPALFEHSGQRVDVPIDTDAERLRFAYGMMREAFDDARTDGVDFVIVGTFDEGDEVELFRDEYVPRSDPAVPAWRTAEVPLDVGGRRLRRLTLVVDERANSSTDWAGWADLAFDPPAPAQPAQYERLGSVGATTVYRNTTVAPRAFVVHNTLSVRDQAAAISFFERTEGRYPSGAVHVTNFDPLATAVVEGRSPLAPCAGRSTARIVAYERQRSRISVDAACPGLLVLTDTFYPGWKAQVDGREARILPTDILFRGVQVPAGRSEVTFSYEPSNFRSALFAPPLGLLLWCGWVVIDRRRRRGSASGRGAIVAAP